MSDGSDRGGGEVSPAASAGPGVAIDTGESTPPGPPGRPALVASTGRRVAGKELAVALVFLVPALVVLLLWVVWPVVYTVWRSLYDAGGDRFVGFDNFLDMFDRDSTRRAITNNVVWVIVAPTLATALGLVFAVLTERIRFGTAFKVVIFMPMAISFLAAGVIFRLVYEQDPDRGLANALLSGVVEVFESPGPYPGARPSDSDLLDGDSENGYLTTATFRPGEVVPLGLVGVDAALVPGGALPATTGPDPPPDALAGTVWLDFTRGGGGERGEIDPTEVGLAGAEVEAVDPSGDVAGSATSDDDGTFTIDGLDPGDYRLRLAASTFRAPWGGFLWLGPSLVTGAVIGSFLWIWAGFAMVVIAAGLAAIPRETMEAARVDGANEWQVFRRVTVPLLWPVLLVVAVTLVINVLKIFDLVLVIPPGSVQDDANVIALELWRVSFGGAQDQGLGSALGVLLFVLVLPAMAFNIRRFRAENR